MSRPAYDRQLRVIGQALEDNRIQTFDLAVQGDQYVIRGAPEKPGSLLARLQRWSDAWGRVPAAKTLRYAVPDIQRLERDGRARRSKPDRLPEFYSLPNTLRTIGLYLDELGAELLELRKRQLSVTLLYRTRDGYPRLEERPIVSFYRLFVDLHARRGKLPRA